MSNEPPPGLAEEGLAKILHEPVSPENAMTSFHIRTTKALAFLARQIDGVSEPNVTEWTKNHIAGLHRENKHVTERLKILEVSLVKANARRTEDKLRRRASEVDRDYLRDSITDMDKQFKEHVGSCFDPPCETYEEVGRRIKMLIQACATSIPVMDRTAEIRDLQDYVKALEASNASWLETFNDVRWDAQATEREACAVTVDEYLRGHEGASFDGLPDYIRNRDGKIHVKTVDEARVEEREACAKLAREWYNDQWPEVMLHANRLHEAICNRGNP